MVQSEGERGRKFNNDYVNGSELTQEPTFRPWTVTSG